MTKPRHEEYNPRKRVAPQDGPPQKLRGVEPTEAPHYIPPYDEDMELPDSNDSNESMAGGDGDIVPASNLRMAANGRANGHETSVDPVRQPVLRPFRETQNTILPWYGTGNSVSLATGTTETAVKTFGFRLNSCYDLLTSSTYVEDGTVVADTNDANKEVPIMREFWQSIYLYWTVTRCDYKVRFWTTDKNDQEIEIWCYHHGQQAPPKCENGDTGTVLWGKYRKLHKHCHMKTFRTHGTNKTEFNKLDNITVMTGSYHPGSVNHDVAEDTLNEIWHKAASVPSSREVATFFIQRSERSPHDQTAVISYDIELVYNVQWKDLKAKIQYMTPTVDLTINNFANSTTQ